MMATITNGKRGAVGLTATAVRVYERLRKRAYRRLSTPPEHEAYLQGVRDALYAITDEEGKDD